MIIMVETPEEYAALLDTYGPLYPYGQFKRGETIRYRVPGFNDIYVGEVLWTQAPGIVGKHRFPMRYVVHCEQRGFVDIVFVTDLVRDEPS
jgi:hypothetical protein